MKRERETHKTLADVNTFHFTFSGKMFLAVIEQSVEEIQVKGIIVRDSSVDTLISSYKFNALDM